MGLETAPGQPPRTHHSIAGQGCGTASATPLCYATPGRTAHPVGLAAAQRVELRALWLRAKEACDLQALVETMKESELEMAQREAEESAQYLDALVGAKIVHHCILMQYIFWAVGMFGFFTEGFGHNVCFCRLFASLLRRKWISIVCDRSVCKQLAGEGFRGLDPARPLLETARTVNRKVGVRMGTRFLYDFVTNCWFLVAHRSLADGASRKWNPWHGQAESVQLFHRDC